MQHVSSYTVKNRHKKWQYRTATNKNIKTSLQTIERTYLQNWGRKQPFPPMGLRADTQFSDLR